MENRPKKRTCAQDAPRGPQDAPRTLQDAPETAQDACKTRPRRPKTAPETAQDASCAHVRFLIEFRSIFNFNFDPWNPQNYCFSIGKTRFFEKNRVSKLTSILGANMGPNYPILAPKNRSWDVLGRLWGVLGPLGIVLEPS